MSEKHTTQDLVFWLGCRKTNNSAHNFVIDAIIARLRAADALCSAAKDLENLAKHMMMEVEEPYDETELYDIRKAIADYEEGQ